MHSRFVNNLENIEDELGIYAPEALSEFEQQIFDAQFELSQRLDRLINQLTHPGARSRPELSTQLPNQAAA
jgi:prolyl-tRNA synthetase